ncbi:unnamed protein product, partial [Urochloa humidicola]
CGGDGPRAHGRGRPAHVAAAPAPAAGEASPRGARAYAGRRRRSPCLRPGRPSHAGPPMLGGGSGPRARGWGVQPVRLHPRSPPPAQLAALACASACARAGGEMRKAEERKREGERD